MLGEPALAALGAPFAVAAAAGIALARDPRVRVRASVTPERMLEGDEAVVTYERPRRRRRRVARAAPRAAAGLVAEPGAAARVLRIAPGDHRLVDVPVRATRWGGHLAGGARVRATGVVGAVWFTGAAPAEAAVRVLPGIERLRTLVAPARTQAAVGPRRSRRPRRRARARRGAPVGPRRPRAAAALARDGPPRRALRRRAPPRARGGRR